jgi:hypothetical protein
MARFPQAAEKGRFGVIPNEVRNYRPLRSAFETFGGKVALEMICRAENGSQISVKVYG